MNLFRFHRALSVLLLGVALVFLSPQEALRADDSITVLPAWEAAGTGTHFQVTGVSGTVSVDSSVAVTLALESFPNMVTVAFAATTSTPASTQIIISGLRPSATYFMSQDRLGDQASIATDTSGAISLVQQIDANPHMVIIQPTHSTVYLRNDATGGDCTAVGNWNSFTATCTLTADITGTVEIDSNGITLDGNSHAISGGSLGVYLFGISNVTITNTTVTGFNIGIRLYNSTNNTISHNTVASNGTGLYLSESSYNTIANNTASNNTYVGIYVDSFSYNTDHDNTISGNTFSGNGSIGALDCGLVLITYRDSGNNRIDANTLNNNGRAGICLTGSGSLTNYVVSNNDIENNGLQNRNGSGLIVPYTFSGLIYHNDIINNATPPSVYPPSSNISFSAPLPLGGNHWSEYDTPAQGCVDADGDGICDAPYLFSGGQDSFPWVGKNGWSPSPPPSISSLNQYKSDAMTAIPEGGTTSEDEVVFAGALQSSSGHELQLEVEYTTSATFTGTPNAMSAAVPPGSVATATAQNLQNGSYRWRARAVDAVTSAASDWQDFGSAGNIDFVVNNLGQDAASLALLVIGDPYLGDGDTFGGKGWDDIANTYVTPGQIGSGYNYWNNKLRRTAFGAGLDCSGLVEWSFNRSFDPLKTIMHNAIRYEGVSGQYLHNSEPVAESDLRPGDLLFFGTLSSSGQMSNGHVAMYVGDHGTFDVVHAAAPSLGIITAHKDLLKTAESFLVFRRVLPGPAIGGSVQAGSPIDLTVTDPDGLTISAATALQTSEEYLREVAGELYYYESVLGADGRPDASVYWPVQKTGDYLVQVAPQAGVTPTSTYSLTFRSGNTTIALAQNLPVSQIPSQGYGVTVSAAGQTSTFIPVGIEIKPGSSPASINLKSNGLVPVAVLGSATFDVRQIDPTTVRLAGAAVALKGNGQPMASYEDVNGDGITDLVVHVPTQALQLTPADVKASLVGFLLDGTEIKGSEPIQIVH
jgi:parallel beta-helix repeat protein